MCQLIYEQPTPVVNKLKYYVITHANSLFIEGWGEKKRKFLWCH